ncbi:GlsB/YeaQ/YmgE family stress response membrane protein [Microvirga roseola]|uniref:GlsB/YeaQ/YmgE family stress response membrane protein n=1 Tax=Microvirga roseola TaxID=2883126 RepID=UPI002AC365B9|nr:GlsB/YeaQ/YmgE family stress response membrane protein [Microvirga roseola]
MPIRISVDREALDALDRRAIAAQVGIGIVAGWLASWLVGGSGLLQYVISGLAGSLVGGFLLERFGIDLGIRNQTATRIVTATLGAIIVVLLARLIG